MAKIECPNCGENNDGSGKFCVNCGNMLPVSTVTDPVLSSSASLQNDPASAIVQLHYPMPPKKNRTWMIIVLVATVAIMQWGGILMFYRFVLLKRMKRQMMAFVVQDANRECPQMVDKITRMDGLRSLGDTALEYLYTLDLERSSIDKDLIITNTTPELVEGIKNDNELKFLRKVKITFIYTYRYKDGETIFSIPIRPAMYE